MLEIILNYLPLFALAVFIGTALWGDGFVIFFSVLAYNLGINMAFVAIAAYFGSILGDIIWYIFGLRLMKAFNRSKKFRKNYSKLEYIMENYLKNRQFEAVFFAKFLFGTRVVTTIYLAHKKIRLKTFLLYDSVATLGWVAFMIALGWLVARGYSWVVGTFKSVELGVTLIIVFLLLFNYIQRKINEKIEKN
jgi:membrane protein DedA with SNARE-associated domain